MSPIIGTAVSTTGTPTEGYCSPADVQRIITRFQFTESTKITSDDVSKFIENKYYEINGVLSKVGITLPVSGTAALAALKEINALGAGGMVETYLILGQEPNSSHRGEFLTKQYKERLQQIAINPNILYDAAQYDNRLASTTEDELDRDRAFPASNIDEFIDYYRHDDNIYE